MNSEAITQMTQSNPIETDLQSYFTDKLNAHGATFKGVDWNSKERQSLCFKQLMRICENPLTGDIAKSFTLNDYGCGYGGLVEYLIEHEYEYTAYTGYEITQGMYEQAIHLFGQVKDCHFTTNLDDVNIADYVIGSGLLSLKLDYSLEVWEQHVLKLLDQLWSLCSKGLAFNSLTKYSDPELMRSDLYYADPGFLFDYCKTHFSRNVALLHDYEAYEFTILVRRSV